MVALKWLVSQNTVLDLTRFCLCLGLNRGQSQPMLFIIFWGFRVPSPTYQDLLVLKIVTLLVIRCDSLLDIRSDPDRGSSMRGSRVPTAEGGQVLRTTLSPRLMAVAPEVLSDHFPLPHLSTLYHSSTAQMVSTGFREDEKG